MLGRSSSEIDHSLVQASECLKRGNPFEALKWITSKEDLHSLAIRGIALAQLSEYDRARRLLTTALAGFRERKDTLWVAKAKAALAEIAFAQRELTEAVRALDSRELRELGDHESATYVDIQRARALGLLRKRREALKILETVSATSASHLARAEELAYQGKFREAYAASVQVSEGNPLLKAEAQKFSEAIKNPAFIYQFENRRTPVSLWDIQEIRPPYIDTLRRSFGRLDLSRRPDQFELLLALGRGSVNCENFYGRKSESLEARLRMGLSRLRKSTGLSIAATSEGFVSKSLTVLSPLVLPTAHPIEAVLADGQDWPPRAIAALLEISLRSVERHIMESTEIESLGRGRSRRYRLKNPKLGFATQLLLVSEASSS